MRITIELPTNWGRKTRFRTMVNQIAGQGYIRVLLPTGRLVTIPAKLDEGDTTP